MRVVDPALTKHSNNRPTPDGEERVREQDERTPYTLASRHHHLRPKRTSLLATWHGYDVDIGALTSYAHSGVIVESTYISADATTRAPRRIAY